MKESKKKTLKDAKFLIRNVDRIGDGSPSTKRDVEITLVGNGWFPWETIKELEGRDVRLVVKK